MAQTALERTHASFEILTSTEDPMAGDDVLDLFLARFDERASWQTAEARELMALGDELEDMGASIEVANRAVTDFCADKLVRDIYEAALLDGIPERSYTTDLMGRLARRHAIVRKPAPDPRFRRQVSSMVEAVYASLAAPTDEQGTPRP